jgi:hypothetical protein
MGNSQGKPVEFDGEGRFLAKYRFATTPPSYHLLTCGGFV